LKISSVAILNFVRRSELPNEKYVHGFSCHVYQRSTKGDYRISVIYCSAKQPYSSAFDFCIFSSSGDLFLLCGRRQEPIVPSTSLDKNGKWLHVTVGREVFNILNCGDRIEL
jgi:hypothetical protein